MKIIETTDKVSQVKEFPGLFRCELVHNVTSSSAKFRWDGPKFPKDMWREILSFFQWTYDEHKSESQVRLFVNLKTKTWAAWAPPQEERTGMAAHELPDLEETKSQRAAFKDEDGWMYYGTVHHHCSANAFQSGTDLNNERDQDGIHITVGSMDKPQHDLHARFYMCRIKFEPDMSLFWELGDILKGVSAELLDVIPADALDRIARRQMGAQPEKGEFPKLWRDNVIPVKVNIIETHYGMGYGCGYGGAYGLGTTDYERRVSGVDSPKFEPRYKRLKLAAQRVYDDILTTRYNMTDVLAEIEIIRTNGHKLSCFREAVKKGFVTFDGVNFKGNAGKKAKQALLELQGSALPDTILCACVENDIDLFELRGEIQWAERTNKSWSPSGGPGPVVTAVPDAENTLGYGMD